MKLPARLLGKLIHFSMRWLSKTLDFQLHTHPRYCPRTQYLFAFWHGKQLMVVLKLRKQHQTPCVALVSPSHDGDILNIWLKKLGYDVIRGSSRKDNIRSLVQMIRKLKEGFSLGFGIDGPLGPIHKVKPGMTHMAQKTGIEIIPVGVAFNRKWVVKKAWDLFEIPKPFAKTIFYLGEPIKISPDADLDHMNLLLEAQLHASEQEAALRCI